jgi:hypothetical protein
VEEEGALLIDLKNKEYNNILILNRVSSTRSGSTTWNCKCHCGNLFIASSDHLTRKSSPIKSCGCIIKKRRGPTHKDWKGFEGISGDWWYNHVLRERSQNVRVRVPVSITIEYAWKLLVGQDMKCKLSGLPIQVGTNPVTNTASIDRIDSSKGYEVGNIQWVHKHINFMKRTYDNAYFIGLCKKIAENNRGGQCEV